MDAAYAGHTDGFSSVHEEDLRTWNVYGMDEYKLGETKGYIAQQVQLQYLVTGLHLQPSSKR